MNLTNHTNTRQSHKTKNRKESKYAHLRTKDLTDMYIQLPLADAYMLQLGAVTAKRFNSPLVTLGTLLSFDRTSIMARMTKISDLITSVRLFCNPDLKNHNDVLLKQLTSATLIPFKSHVDNRTQKDDIIYVLVYPTKKGYLISWRCEPFSHADSKQFLSDKGFIQMERYSIN